MLVLFTDFGADDIYVGQLKAALLRNGAAAAPIVDLCHTVPNFAVRAAAHLLAALCGRFPSGTVFLAVVDPGVGGGREPVAVRAQGRWYVGPDNGLLSVLAARAADTSTSRIVWRPQDLSATFHGRDLFAPVAAHLAAGSLPEDAIEPTSGLTVQLGAGDLAEVVYVDHYGNALTGLRATGVPRGAAIDVAGHRLRRRETFSDVVAGEPFWYENSIGLLEIAVNLGSAERTLKLGVGTAVTVV
jgi:hypothetical protein